jgi:hypothetical protein
MEDFVSGYLDTVTRDPATAFAQLTPGFQEASGGLTAYEQFWGGVEKAKLLSIQANPDDLTVSYTVEYNRGHGDKRTDSTTLQLTYDGGQYLIADEF